MHGIVRADLRYAGKPNRFGSRGGGGKKSHRLTEPAREVPGLVEHAGTIGSLSTQRGQSPHQQWPRPRQWCARTREYRIGISDPVVLASTFMIDHFELFGLQQVFRAWRAKPHEDRGFRTVLFYRLVRHPLMLGFLLAFWATPTMTVGHLLVAGTTTGYILIALRLEEHTGSGFPCSCPS